MLSLTELALTMAEADAYATSRGLSAWLTAATSPDDARDAALRRGQDFVAGTYNGRWLTEWENDEAPDAVKYAIVEAARLELVSAGTLTPRMARGGRLKRLRVTVEDAIEREQEWTDGAPAQDTITAIDNVLKAAGLIRSGMVTFLMRA